MTLRSSNMGFHDKLYTTCNVRTFSLNSDKLSSAQMFRHTTPLLYHIVSY